MEELTAARRALEAAAGGLDASCSGRDAVRFLDELGAISRLTDGMTARVSKRVADTGAYTRGWRLGPPDPVTRKRPLDPPRASRAA